MKLSNKAFGYLFAFSLGAAAGSLVAWRLLKDKYEQIAREEIDSVKEVFSKKAKVKKVFAEVDEMHEVVDTDDREQYENAIRDYNTISTAKINNKEGERVEKPYVISPDEFGETGDYECVSLTYYADGVLTDDVDDVIYDVDGIVGEESLTHFGENEGDEDSVYVRNDRTRCDYEILRDQRNYSDVYAGR